jgi:predicted GH43/DUF377 family glycosyl hydrolase
MTNFEPLLWKRCSPEPWIRPQPGTLAPEGVTTPDVLFKDGQYLLYVGAIDSGRERIIVFPFDPLDFVDSRPLSIPATAQAALLAGPNRFDSGHVFDPAAVAFGEEVYLYYSAIGEMEDCIGLATSKDAKDFSKFDHPILVGRSPEIVFHQGRLWLFYVVKSRLKGYDIYSAMAEDGTNFVIQGLALGSGEEQAWDAFEVTTPRIFQHGATYYMVYAASHSPDRKDLPTGFGLARSPDLVRWEKYPENPIFEIGKPGTWDDGAIWFGTVFELNEYLYLVYEGGRLQGPSMGSPPYTQVGLAKIKMEIFDKIVSIW